MQATEQLLFRGRGAARASTRLVCEATQNLRDPRFLLCRTSPQELQVTRFQREDAGEVANVVRCLHDRIRGQTRGTVRKRRTGRAAALARPVHSDDGSMSVGGAR